MRPKTQLLDYEYLEDWNENNECVIAMEGYKFKTRHFYEDKRRVWQAQEILTGGELGHVMQRLSFVGLLADMAYQVQKIKQ